MEQESPHLGRCGPGKAELGETICSHLLPCMSPQCNELEGEGSSGLSWACSSKSTYPTNFTAGTGAMPGGYGRLQALRSGNAVVDAVQGCGTQGRKLSVQRCRTQGHKPSASTYSGRGTTPISISCTSAMVEERRGLGQGHDWVRTRGDVGAPAAALTLTRAICLHPLSLLSLLLSLRTYCPHPFHFRASTCVPTAHPPHGGPIRAHLFTT